MHNIVILGGNFSGVSLAHYLLRHVLPLLNLNKNEPDFKVILVSPSDHTFFKVAAPRALVSTEKSTLQKAFGSIPDAFSQYPTSQFSFVQGEAVQLDEATRTVSINGSTNTNPTSVKYDSLVIATGTTSNSVLWTLHGDHKKTEAAFHDLHKRLSQAKSVLIAGGGAVGVETAGEVASAYKPAKITLLSGGSRLLGHLKHTGVARGAESKLASLNVNTIHNVRVISQEASGSQTILKLSDGTTNIVDVYIDATGGLPNSNFLPPNWLDERRRVVTDASTLRATKAPVGVYSIGDVASFSKGNVIDATWSVPALGYSIWNDLRAIDKKEFSDSSSKTSLKEKKHKQVESDIQVVPIGPQGGVGVLFGWRIPSFFVWLLKARTFMADKAPGLATGEQFLKA